MVMAPATRRSDVMRAAPFITPDSRCAVRSLLCRRTHDPDARRDQEASLPRRRMNDQKLLLQASAHPGNSAENGVGAARSMPIRCVQFLQRSLEVHVGRICRRQCGEARAPSDWAERRPKTGLHQARYRLRMTRDRQSSRRPASRVPFSTSPWAPGSCRFGCLESPLWWTGAAVGTYTGMTGNPVLKRRANVH